MKKWLLLLILAVFAFDTPLHSQHDVSNETPVYKKSGVASYYAKKFNGRTMANGKKYDEKKLTAAHNSLSLGTWVRVSNLRNKKSVIVQITDRMHRKNKRLIDVSREAAQQLGFINRGTAKVSVEVIVNP